MAKKTDISKAGSDFISSQDESEDGRDALHQTSEDVCKGDVTETQLARQFLKDVMDAKREEFERQQGPNRDPFAPRPI